VPDNSQDGVVHGEGSLTTLLQIYCESHVDRTTMCLKKCPTFTTCYNFYTHSSIATIFGINVAEKVRNQNVLYFPTTPN